jgi:hypothetical protein
MNFAVLLITFTRRRRQPSFLQLSSRISPLVGVSRILPHVGDVAPLIPPTVTGKVSLWLVPIPLTPPLHSPCSPSPLSSSIPSCHRIILILSAWNRAVYPTTIPLLIYYLFPLHHFNTVIPLTSIGERSFAITRAWTITWDKCILSYYRMTDLWRPCKGRLKRANLLLPAHARGSEKNY